MTTEAELVALAERLQARCVSLGLTVATAESCTGGLVGHAITSVSGSSAYFRGGVVSYSDEIKTSLLHVAPSVLAAHGAVSAQVAVAMATGARSVLETDLAASVTGIAGPEGGSAAKPVGLTYVAVAGPGGSEVRRALWSGDRAANKLESAEAALAMLLEAVERLSVDEGARPGSSREAGPRAGSGSGTTADSGPGSASGSTP